MIKYLIIMFVGFCPFVTSAQRDTSHLRISLLTCGVGDQVWETFGHTALRVTDSVNGTDNVYNYGTFNGYEEGFELKFMQGKLLYYVSYYPYNAFIQEYLAANRSVDEQLLILDGQKKQSLYDFLQWNAREENRYYKYDFLYDNCATRIRDVFPKTFGNYLRFGKTLPSNSKLTFRQIINQYLYRNHFERFGINILLGSRIDKVMTNEDVMFLPDFLRTGIGNATVKKQKVASAPFTVIAGSPSLPRGINWAFVSMLLIAALTIAGLVFNPINKLGQFMTGFLLLVTGFVGCFILIMWFCTDHQGCGDNFSLLWALPTNLFLGFASKRNKDKYALIAMILLILSLILHVVKVQEIPLLELSPLLLSLLFIYGTIYRKNKLKLY